MNNVFKTLATILVLMCSFIANAAWTVRYQHTDVQGSVIAESNSQGTITQRFDYKPFGEGTPTQKAGVGYTGHLEDTDLGLTYMQQRYYDPVIGRFYSNDPIGFRDTHSFNRYAYANNNPYKYVDPTGMATDLGFCGVSGCDYSYKSGDSSSSDEDRKHYGQKNSNSSNSKSELSLTSLDEQKAVIVGIAEKLATRAAWTVDNSGIEYPDIPWLIPMLRGSAIHTEFSRSIDALGIPEFRGEGPSYLLGYQMPWGSLGSSRPDATFGPIDNPYLAFELKTGFLGMTKIQATRYQINLPSTTELVFIVPLQ